MPSSSYTKLLGITVAPAPGTEILGVVPDGKIWVVRNVQAACRAPGVLLGLQGFVITGSLGCAIHEALPPDVFPNQGYPWEGRAVLNAGDELSAVINDDGWHIQVTGYEFVQL